MTITKHSGIYTLEASQEVNISLEEAWTFFSLPSNLAKITPPEMGFITTSKPQGKAYPGQIITYKVGVAPFVKLNWVTEITQVEELQFFIDEQRFGPYKMWHHEHWFEALASGKTLMRDKISYKLPFGILGAIAHPLFVKSKLKRIFSFREETLNNIFNK